MKQFITTSDSHEVILLATIQDDAIRWETFLEVPFGMRKAISLDVLWDVGRLYGFEARCSVADIEAEVNWVAA